MRPKIVSENEIREPIPYVSFLVEQLLVIRVEMTCQIDFTQGEGGVCPIRSVMSAKQTPPQPTHRKKRT